MGGCTIKFPQIPQYMDTLICSLLWILQEELRPYFSLPKVMDGLFNLAKTLFGIDIEPADGLAPVINIHKFFLCFLAVTENFYSHPAYVCLLFNRFGTMMSDSIVSKILQVVQLHTSILIHIPVHPKKREVRGWMRLFLEVVFCHATVLRRGYLLPTWCAIKPHLLGISQALWHFVRWA